MKKDYPHFAQGNDPQDYSFDAGMNLRDWFAGMALQGELASQSGSYVANSSRAAEKAYRFADAMMKERESST